MQMIETVAWNPFILSQSLNISVESKIHFLLDNSVLYSAVCNYFHLSVNHNSPIALAFCIVSALSRGCSVLSPGQEGRWKGVWVSHSCQGLALGEGRVSVVCFVLLRTKWKVACPSVVLPWRGLALKPPGALCKGGLLSLIMTHRLLIAKFISKRPRKELLSRRNDHKQWWITKELFFSWQLWECDDSNWVKCDNCLRKRNKEQLQSLCYSSCIWLLTEVTLWWIELMEEKSWCLMETGERDCAEKRFFSDTCFLHGHLGQTMWQWKSEYRKEGAYIAEETLTLIVNTVK